MRNMKIVGIIIIGLFIFGCAGRVATWKTIPEITQTKYEEAWSIIVGIVSEQYDLEVIDANSGYLRSGWKYRSGILGGEATRVIVRIVDREPLKIKLKVEKKTRGVISLTWKQAGNDEEIEDEILTELRARLK